ncbi:hypothetical protein [Modestobacter sp. SYSU DS0290]
MSTTDHALDTDALDSWISDLSGGARSMRRLRQRLGAEGNLVADPCPSCQRPATEDFSHTGHWIAEPAD